MLPRISPWLAAGSIAALVPTAFAGDPAPAPYDAVDLPAYRGAHRSSAPASNERWWAQFNDGKLDALVEQGLAENYDLATAESRIDEARSVARQNLAPLLPSLTWDSSANLAPFDSLGFQFGGGTGGGAPMGPTPELYYTASSILNLGVDVDITGRNTLGYKASKRDSVAARSDFEGQALALSTNIVSAYYDVVTARAQLEVVQRQISTNEELVELTKLRFENGQANAIDVLQQEQQLASTQTLLPQATTQVQAFEQQLSVLVGRAPGAPLSPDAALPPLPPQPPVGKPHDLVKARPDLRAASERAEAAQLREKTSRRQFAPNLRLSAQAGAQAIHINDWNAQTFWGAGATLSVPLYNGGQVISRLHQSKAQSRTANHQLSAATLNAVREVEDALMREEQQQRSVVAFTAREQAAKAAFEESKRRYLEGLGEYLPVLTALTAVQQAELDVITAKRDLIATRIQLHRALGDAGISTERSASR